VCAVNTLQLTGDGASNVQLRVICIADKPYELASLCHYRHDAAGSECRIVCRGRETCREFGKVVVASSDGLHLQCAGDNTK
jgi:hypothetical protein